MYSIETLRNLIGQTLTEDDLRYVDCYVRPQLGIFIPVGGVCGYAAKNQHSHPAYMITICFEQTSDSQTHYHAEITSPDVPHSDRLGVHYYCIMIEKEYFSKRWLMYEDSIPYFNEQTFEMCSDILKALNTFVFEAGKSMLNSDITLDAQAEIITHWIIRSIIGETLDLRAVSYDYSVARAQHYMELHYSENITVAKLAELGYVSESCFNRRFKKETGTTPFEYLIEIRIRQAKTMLRRKNVPVTEIAMRCGFGSSAHFSSCFQKRTGTSPSEYREKYF